MVYENFSLATSLFLAKAFGIYFLIMTLIIVANPKGFRQQAESLLSHEGATWITAFITLVLGILLIVAHNVWVLGWPLIITILGWLTFIKGAVNLTFPRVPMRMLVLLQSNSYLYTVCIIMFLFGIYLFGIGYGFI